MEASRLPTAERATFLDDECSDDPGMRADVERLLAAEEEVDTSGFMMPGPICLRSILPADEPDPNTGRIVGKYQIIKTIGSGGMGRVYEALRLDDYRQLVALKIVKPGVDTPEVLKLLVYERQTLAALKHEYIARLLDGGTDDERPYFVMDLVRGTRIDAYCDRHQLTVRERVELFAKVCEAVAYAHKRTIVHRDLKPANILIDEDGAPKLLDFGLARLLNPEISFAQDAPTDGQRYLTISYASPEQVQGDTVGRPSDVYALGVILYELLSGHKPFWLESLERSEVEQIVSYQMPPRPSAVIGRPYQLRRRDGEIDRVTPQSIAELRGVTPPRLQRALQGDLDDIVMHCLRKEPRERYQDAGALLADIERHLADRRIVAGRDPALAIVSKFVRRNRIVVAWATIAFLLLVIGLIGTTAFWMRAELNKEEAIAAGVEAKMAEHEAAVQAERAERAERDDLARRFAVAALLDPIDAGLSLALALHAVEISPTNITQFALRWALLRGEPERTLKGHREAVDRAVFSHDGLFVASAGEDGMARVWNVDTGDVLHELTAGSSGLNLATFGPDDATLLTAGDDGVARLWNLDDGAIRFELIGHRGPIRSAEFSPDWRWIITAGEDGTVRIWDAKTGDDIDIIDRWKNPVADVAVSPDGARVVEALEDGSIHLKDGVQGKEIAVLRGHWGPVVDASFSSDSRRLVTASGDRSARIWNAETGAYELTLAGHLKGLRQAVFSPDDRWVATSGRDGTVRVWNAETGECLRTEGGDSAAFSPDGQWLVIADLDGTVRIVPWELFAPLDFNEAEARRRAPRPLTPEELEYFSRERTVDELEDFMRRWESMRGQ